VEFRLDELRSRPGQALFDYKDAEKGQRQGVLLLGVLATLPLSGGGENQRHPDAGGWIWATCGRRRALTARIRLSTRRDSEDPGSFEVHPKCTECWCT